MSPPLGSGPRSRVPRARRACTGRRGGGASGQGLRRFRYARGGAWPAGAGRRAARRWRRRWRRPRLRRRRARCCCWWWAASAAARGCWPTSWRSWNEVGPGGPGRRPGGRGAGRARGRGVPGPTFRARPGSGWVRGPRTQGSGRGRGPGGRRGPRVPGVAWAQRDGAGHWARVGRGRGGVRFCGRRAPGAAWGPGGRRVPGSGVPAGCGLPLLAPPLAGLARAAAPRGLLSPLLIEAWVARPPWGAWHEGG